MKLSQVILTKVPHVGIVDPYNKAITVNPGPIDATPKASMSSRGTETFMLAVRVFARLTLRDEILGTPEDDSDGDQWHRRHPQPSS